MDPQPPPDTRLSFTPDIDKNEYGIADKPVSPRMGFVLDLPRDVAFVVEASCGPRTKRCVVTKRRAERIFIDLDPQPTPSREVWGVFPDGGEIVTAPPLYQSLSGDLVAFKEAFRCPPKDGAEQFGTDKRVSLGLNV